MNGIDGGWCVLSSLSLDDGLLGGNRPDDCDVTRCGVPHTWHGGGDDGGVDACLFRLYPCHFVALRADSKSA